MGPLEITMAELCAFHAIDRHVYSRLVINLARNIVVSKEVIAFWLWLEESGCRDFCHIVSRLEDESLVLVADEAVKCLIFMGMPNLPPQPFNAALPLTTWVSGRNVTIEYVFDNRDHGLKAVAKSVSDALNWAFEDIVELAARVEENRKLARQMGMFAHAIQRQQQQTMPMGPVFPQLLAGMCGLSFNEARSEPQNQNRDGDCCQDDRTLFLTFSKGYPITESELVNFFNGMYGDCVELVQMQEIIFNLDMPHPIFARLVLRSASAFTRILEGQEKKKFTIKGKHAWARVYMPKRSSPPRPI